MATVASLARSMRGALWASIASPVLTSALEVMDACGMAPDPWQRECLESDAPDQILFSCRQAGKTDLSALIALVQAASTPDTFCPVVASREDQAAILVKRAQGWLRRIGERGCKLAAAPLPQARYAGTHLRLDNGSEVRAFPASQAAARGDTATGDITVDEAAQVPDDVLTALLPQRTMTRTILRLLSTPWYTQGRFFEMFCSRAPGTRRWRVIAPPEYGVRLGVDLTGLETCGLPPEQAPDVTPEECTRMPWEGFVAATKGMMHEEVRREMFGIFSDASQGSVFGHAAIQAALSHSVEPLWADTLTRPPSRGVLTPEDVEPLFGEVE